MTDRSLLAIDTLVVILEHELDQRGRYHGRLDPDALDFTRTCFAARLVVDANGRRYLPTSDWRLLLWQLRRGLGLTDPDPTPPRAGCHCGRVHTTP